MCGRARATASKRKANKADLLIAILRPELRDTILRRTGKIAKGYRKANNSETI
jgi:hypothetical protein